MSATVTEFTRDNGFAGPRKRIVVTGMGVASCFGSNVDTFYDTLLSGKSGVRKVDTFDVEGWTTNFAASIPKELRDPAGYVSPKMARRLDPFLLYSIVTGKKALEHAGLAMGSEEFEKLDKFRCGVICGSGMGGLQVYSHGVETLTTKNVTRMSPFTIPYAITNMGSAMLAIDLGFRGPNYSISTACATGNFCINNAAIHIQRDECDLCIAGGVEAAVLPIGLGGFIACRALSSRNDEPQKASRPWDKGRDGFVMGEGAGLLVLESLEHAKKRGATIYAEYLGGAQNCDAYHMTDPRKDGSGVQKCIQMGLKDSGLGTEDIDYLNAHATSTPAGDMAEYKAVRSVFNGDVSHVKMNATKSMIGHALGAAGGLEAVAMVKAIQTNKLHPTINVEDKEEEVDIDICANEMKEHKVNASLSMSFGFGGHNSVVALGRYKE